MKIKKILTAITTLCLAGTTVLAGFAGCKKGCNHAYTWEITVAPTCIAGGEREGTCGICGKEITEQLSADANAHAYGEWSVEKPTESAAGKATKVCTLDGTHKREITLPALTADFAGYASAEITTQPKVFTDGERTLVFSDETGDVSFTEPVPAKGVNTFEDAVNAVLERKNYIRSGSGTVTYDKYDQVAAGQPAQLNTEQSGSHTVSYEFGDNYTHTFEGSDNSERWYSLDENGEPWGFLKTSQGTLQKETLIENMNGARVYLLYTGYNANGAEETLNGLYRMGKASSNGDLIERVKDGVYQFSFGDVNKKVLNSDKSIVSANFVKITVQFTVDEDFALKTLAVTSNVYVYNSGLGIETWKFDKNGYAYVADPKGARSEETISFVQKTVKEAQAAGEPVPVNPYDKNAVLLTGYDLKNGSKVIGEGDVVTIAADSVKDLTIDNLQPSTANLSFDKISVYMLGENGEEILLGADTLNKYKILAYFNEYNGQRITIRSQLSGEITLILKTTNLTKTLKINVNTKAPSKISPAVWEYGDNGYTWNTATDTATVYVGQELNFLAQPDENEQSYVNCNYTATVTSANAANASLVDSMADDKNTTLFSAKKVGTYTIECVSEVGGKKCTLTVNVVEAPDINSVLSGEYKGRLTEQTTVMGEVTVQFQDGKTTQIVDRGEQKVELIKGKITVKTTKINVTLTYTAEKTENGIELITQPVGTAQDPVFEFSVIVNEAYKIVLTHPTGFGTKKESVTLHR